MIQQETLTQIANGINSVPCPMCGESHRINLSLNSHHSFAQSSADWLFLPGGNVFVEIEEGDCEEFRERLILFLTEKLSSL